MLWYDVVCCDKNAVVNAVVKAVVNAVVNVVVNARCDWADPE